ncbi:xanthine dehydrogenase family protein molybdopterin-binding subunit [Pararhodonellum marinum]|uniref:xanthine dehydrogenase family protein molybdopterin-binding subunit n=1 Tax=Pararhodonellum marinum TaxID=2755358 RepID=UPI0018906125|nr:molybdopterin cofactor-binding domain-containing protein [Pararhodonellum marinum]
MVENTNNEKLINKGRRDFIKSSGYLMVGFNLFPIVSCVQGNQAETKNLNEEFPRPLDANQINAWLKIDEKGLVTVMTGKMELGQGIKTALQQIAAEELDVSMDNMRILIADTGITQDERYTAGSGSIEGSGGSIRNAAATARQLLLEMAAKKLEVNENQLSIKDGIVSDMNSTKTISYGALVQNQQIDGKTNEAVKKKDPAAYKIVGRPILREDIRNLVLGNEHFIHDLRLPEMVHARVLRPPVYKAKIKSIPETEVKSIPGVLSLIRDGNYIAVIADEEYAAVKALKVLKEKSVWEKHPLSLDDPNLKEAIFKSDEKEQVVDGEKQFAWASDAQFKTLEASYFRPYHMHGSIGPSCAIAMWKEDFLTIWSPSQGVYPLRRTVSDLLKIPEEKIRAIGVPGSGCYGHNGADDVSADAALLAIKFPGRPVRVQWMREDEHSWEPYGSAMGFTLKAQIDREKKVSFWQTKLWSDTHSTRPNGKAGHFIGARHLDQPFNFDAGGFSGGSYRNATPLYNFGGKQIISIPFVGPLRTSALRSLGAYANIFALESFMDELAYLAERDVVQFRLDQLEDPRARAVIEEVVEKSDFKSKSSNVGKGLAFSRYKKTAAYLAVVAEVKIDPVGKTFRCSKLTAVIDAGQVINSDGLKNQTEGGMIQSASWTLKEYVRFNAQGIKSTSWETYPIFRFEDVPKIEVLVLDRPQEKALGAGEAAQGPVAAAIANAIFDATKSRVRDLPITPDKIQWSR